MSFHFPPVESQLRSHSSAFFASLNTTADEITQLQNDDNTSSIRSSPAGDLLNNNEDDPPSSDLPQSAADGFPFDPRGAALSQLARRIIRKANFSDKLAQEFEEFLVMTEAEQRLAQFAISLQIRASLEDRKKVNAENFHLSDELKSTIKTYARAALLSPTITSYRGDVAKHILVAMQNLNIRGLPEVTEVAMVRKVIKEIGTALTNFRSTMKDKFKGSLTEGSSTRNIADLTHAIISNTPIQVTLQHYIRFAFLRWTVENISPNTTEEEFWLAVDSTIHDIRTTCKTEAAITRCFLQKYEDDKSKYGNPADTAHVVTEPNAVAAWQTTVARHAANVLGNYNYKKRKVATVE